MLVEKAHRGCFIVSEANGSRSREEINLIKGQNLQVGTILGKITESGEYTQYNSTATNGSQTVAGILYDNINATEEDRKAVVIIRDAEIAKDKLIYPDDSDDTKNKANEELKALGLIIR